MVVRNVIRIDEELCNGCGLCITPCAEGAIELRNGKAHVVSDALCDGAGFCLAVCPTGALSVEARDAEAFDAHVAQRRAEERGPAYVSQSCFRCGAGEERPSYCPAGAMARVYGYARTACRPSSTANGCARARSRASAYLDGGPRCVQEEPRWTRLRDSSPRVFYAVLSAEYDLFVRLGSAAGVRDAPAGAPPACPRRAQGAGRRLRNGAARHRPGQGRL